MVTIRLIVVVADPADFEIHGPRAVRIECIGSRRPIGGRHSIWESSGIYRRLIFAIVHQGLQFAAVGQPPVTISGKGEIFTIGRQETITELKNRLIMTFGLVSPKIMFRGRILADDQVLGRLRVKKKEPIFVNDSSLAQPLKLLIVIK